MLSQFRCVSRFIPNPHLSRRTPIGTLPLISVSYDATPFETLIIADIRFLSLSKRLVFDAHLVFQMTLNATSVVHFTEAAARCWRDGQKKRCFTYRFLATGTVEEKIFQRQLSKEGLQSVVDDKEQVNALSTKDLRNLFKLRSGTPSDTHDKLRCERCKIIADHAEMEAAKILPKKLDACRELLTRIEENEDAAAFLKPLVPTDQGVSKEEYEKKVKQPMDLGTIRNKLNLAPDETAAYNNVSGFSKDVNRIFANVMKVWSPGEEIADAARRLQVRAAPGVNKRDAIHVVFAHHVASFRHFCRHGGSTNGLRSFLCS